MTDTLTMPLRNRAVDKCSEQPVCAARFLSADRS